MRTISVLLLMGCLACAGDGSGGGSLTHEECTRLMERITEISYQDLSEEDRQEALSETDNRDAIESCARGENWARRGFECAMQAKTTDELNRCVRLGG